MMKNQKLIILELSIIHQTNHFLNIIIIMMLKSKLFFSTIKQKILQNSFKNVNKYGWNDKAILATCQQFNLSPASHRIITSYDIIAYAMRKWNNNALQKITDTNFGNQKSIKNKIHYAIKQRLSQEIQYIDTWHQAMAQGAHPSNITTTKDILWEYSDKIWKMCGDKSTDYNYYTKRILFNGAYASTELYMLTDRSQGKEATWQFLQRRLEQITTMGSALNSSKIIIGSLAQGFLNLTGMFNRVPQKIQDHITNYSQQNIQDRQKNQKQAISGVDDKKKAQQSKEQ